MYYVYATKTVRSCLAYDGGRGMALVPTCSAPKKSLLNAQRLLSLSLWRVQAKFPTLGPCPTIPDSFSIYIEENRSYPLKLYKLPSPIT